MNTSRLEAFSDGVFAVAITLLVLQFTVPEVQSGKLLAKVLDQWPQLVTYLASFLTVGVVWVNHHTIFRNLRAVDRTIQFINLVLLLTVVLVPYPTALLGRYLNSGVDGSVAAAFYAVSIGLASSAPGWWWPSMRSMRSTTRSIKSLGQGSESDRRVHAAQVATRYCAQLARVLETRLRRHLLPARVRERVRHPRVAPIRSVLDHDQPAARPKHRLDACQHRALVAEKVQRVGHDDAVQPGQQTSSPPPRRTGAARLRLDRPR